MINILSMNRVGIDSNTLKFLFEFEFDNGSTLPEKAFAVGSKTYLIADGSTAQNIITSTRYEYNKGKWTKLTTTSEDTTTNTNKITDNGIYNIPNNEGIGFSDVSVDVAGGSVTLIEKSITDNGEYLASADNADGYSKVTVDVAGGGGETFEVEMTIYYDNHTYTCNKTYAEVDSAYEAGKNVICTVTWQEGEGTRTLQSYGVMKQELPVSESESIHYITFALSQIIYGQGPAFPTMAMVDEFDGQQIMLFARGSDTATYSPL